VIGEQRPILLTRKHLEMPYREMGKYQHDNHWFGRDVELLSRLTIREGARQRVRGRISIDVGFSLKLAEGTSPAKALAILNPLLRSIREGALDVFGALFLCDSDFCQDGACC